MGRRDRKSARGAQKGLSVLSTKSERQLIAPTRPPRSRPTPQPAMGGGVSSSSGAITISSNAPSRQKRNDRSEGKQKRRRATHRAAQTIRSMGQQRSRLQTSEEDRSHDCASYVSRVDGARNGCNHAAVYNQRATTSWRRFTDASHALLGAPDHTGAAHTWNQGACRPSEET